MAKKSQSKSQTKSSIEDKNEDVTHLWSEFSNQMESKFRDLFETSAVEYREIYKNWTELSDKMGKQMLNFTIGDETIYKNVYDSWKEHSEKLNSGLGKLSKADDKSYNEFYDFWSDYSDKFGTQLSGLMRDGLKEQYELYELWMDTFAKSANEGSKSGDIPSIINKYWLEAFNRFNKLYSQKGTFSSGKSDDLEPGEHIYKQCEEMYNYWFNTTQNMIDEVLRSPAYGNLIAQSLNSSMDARKTMENMMTQNLKSLGVPTKNELEEIRWELKNISTHLDELHQSIQNLPKNK